MIIEKGVMFGDLPDSMKDQGWSEDAAGFIRAPSGEIVAREFGAEMRGRGVVSLGDIVRATVEKLTESNKEIKNPKC